MASLELGRANSGHVTVHDVNAVKQIIADRHVRIRTLSNTDTETKKTGLMQPHTAPEVRQQTSENTDAARIFTEWLSNKAVGSVQVTIYTFYQNVVNFVQPWALGQLLLENVWVSKG